MHTLLVRSSHTALLFLALCPLPLLSCTLLSAPFTGPFQSCLCLFIASIKLQMRFLHHLIVLGCPVLCPGLGIPGTRPQHHWYMPPVSLVHTPCISSTHPLHLWHTPPASLAHTPASLAHAPYITGTCPQHHWYTAPASLVHVPSITGTRPLHLQHSLMTEGSQLKLLGHSLPPVSVR